MQENKLLSSLLIIISVFLLILSIINCVAIVSELSIYLYGIDNKSNGLTLKTFNKVNAALKTNKIPEKFTFTASFSSPFRPFSEEKVAIRPVGSINKIKQVYRKLFLKGTLKKDNPLAILEDEDGKTYICKPGDVVDNRHITSVTDEEVKIKEPGGEVTVLKVKEQ